VRLPDFIIGGAPKCATSSLHDVLAAHDEIGIPAGELHFFDADDPVAHPDFFSLDGQGLVSYDCEPEGPLFAAYAERFRNLQDARFIGEDSTAYIFSDVAPDRIKRMLPGVKLIFMLRDPVTRAYSQYWHMVNHGRTNLSFEWALLAHPRLVLASTYARHLECYFDLFGREQVKVILFEDFVRDPRATVDSVTDYLGASRFNELPEEGRWSNRTYYPRIPSMQLMLNRVRMRLIAGRYRDHLGSRGEGMDLGMATDRFLRRLRLLGEKAPPMRPSTREFLTDHLSERNRGLSDLLQRDLSQVWQGFTS
jgi:hypothetical protein